MNTPSQTIVLIHGYGFDDRTWNPVELAFDGYDVLRLRLPGFGNDTITSPYTIESLAEHFWKELDLRANSVVHLVGHSMGGYVCMEMLGQQPDRVSSLCLIHSHVFADADEKKKARTGVLEEIRSAGREAFVRRMITSMVYQGDQKKAFVEQLIARGLHYDDDAWYNGTQAIRDRKDHEETLKNFSGPCAIIMGEADTAVPLALGHKQAALIAQGNLITYPEVGHLAMYENTAQLIDDLVTFYSGQ